MPDTKQIPTKKMILRYSGIFDLDKLYKSVYEWMINEGYYFEETKYKHKVPSPAGAEQHIKFRGWRRNNEYVKYWIELYFILYNMKDIQVVKEGKKTKLQKAMLLIEIVGKIELDYNKKYHGSKFLLALRDWMDTYILGKPLEGMIGSIWWDELYYKTIKLQTLIKDVLDMQTKGNAHYDMW